MKKASENKFLKVAANVVLTPTIEPRIVALDEYYERFKVMAWVTSGLRTPLGQLKIIQNYLRTKVLHTQYSEALEMEVDDKMDWQGQNVYKWQPGWSALLNKGLIINPPRPAMVLMDYIRDGKNKKGQMIQGSPHFAGTAFDIGGNKDGIDNELTVLKYALEQKIPGIRGYLIERNNNCIHIDCEKI